MNPLGLEPTLQGVQLARSFFSSIFFGAMGQLVGVLLGQFPEKRLLQLVSMILIGATVGEGMLIKIKT